MTLPGGLVGALEPGRNVIGIVVQINRAVDAEKQLILRCAGEQTTLVVRCSTDLVTSFYLSLLYQHYDFAIGERYAAVQKSLLAMRASRLAARRSLAQTAARAMSTARRYR